MTAEASCLECHSTPDVAPPAMIRKYGSVNGFGWTEGQVVAAQIVSVPMDVPVQIARKAFNRLLLFLIITFLLTIAALDTAVYMLVIRPLKVVSDAADRISKGETDLPEVAVGGKDEIANVTSSFNRMRVSLEKALRMLEQ
jgi:protein-histidine pros-kinase